MSNLEFVLNQADESDRKAALVAYAKYNTLVGTIAAKHGFTVRVGAAVFAALSPNNDYHGNLRDTDRLLEAARLGLDAAARATTRATRARRRRKALASRGGPAAPW